MTALSPSMDHGVLADVVPGAWVRDAALVLGGAGFVGLASQLSVPLPFTPVPLSLATATAEQLDQLDGIGPTLAGRIIEFRDENGGFRTVEQLQEVEGIGEKRFATLKEAVRP